MEVLLGEKQTLGGPRPFYLDINPHTWLIGKSGTGKSTAMLSGIVGALQAGAGVCVVDPHGDLIRAVLEYIPPERLKDIVYIDPLSEKVPGIGYFDPVNTELSTQGFMSNVEARAGKGWGMRSARIMRGAADAVLSLYKRPTILHIYKFLARPTFARSLMRASMNPLVADFFDEWFSKDVKQRERREAFAAPLNKIDELMRPGVREFVAQRNALNWQKLLDGRKIVLVKLPKGEIGTNPAKILGSLVLMNIMLAAPRRKKRGHQFTVFVDEIHNFLDGIDFETCLAELRKFGTNFFFATQTTAQMRDEERRIWNDEIAFGNCSNIIAFRVGGKDSEKVALNCADEEGAPSLVRLPNYQFYAWTLTKGLPILEGPVILQAKPALSGTEVPYQQALASAVDNTGTEKSVIQAQIEKHLAAADGSPRPSPSPSKPRVQS